MPQGKEVWKISGYVFFLSLNICEMTHIEYKCYLGDLDVSKSK